MNALRKLHALASFARLARDPSRLGEVFEMSDALATPGALEPIVSRIAERPEVALALEERARLTLDLPSLRALPAGTLGRAFADHMDAAGLDPAAIPTLESPDRVSFFRAHLYETHDIWHVVTGFGVDWCAEIGLQAFYMAQIPGPLPGMLLGVGLVRGALFEKSARVPLADAVATGWRMGRAAKPLFGVRWDTLWERPLAAVRAELGVAVDAPANQIAA